SRKTAARPASSAGTPPASSSRRARSRYSTPARSPAANTASWIRVATKPGASAFTAMPCSASSAASVSARRTTPALLAAYALKFGNGDVAPPPERSTIRPPPCARIARPTARATRNVPHRSMRTASSHSAGSRSSAGPIGPITAAACTRPSIRPAHSTTRATSASTAVATPTSATKARTASSPPISASRASASRKVSGLRAAIATRAPAATASAAHASPIPWLPPVTRITFPARLSRSRSSPARPRIPFAPVMSDGRGHRRAPHRRRPRQVRDHLRSLEGDPVVQPRHPLRRHEPLQLPVLLRAVQHQEAATPRARDLPPENPELLPHVVVQAVDFPERNPVRQAPLVLPMLVQQHPPTVEVLRLHRLQDPVAKVLDPMERVLHLGVHRRLGVPHGAILRSEHVLDATAHARVVERQVRQERVDRTTRRLQRPAGHGPPHTGRQDREPAILRKSLNLS